MAVVLIVKPLVHKLTRVDLWVVGSGDFQLLGDALVGLFKPRLVRGMDPEDLAVLSFESMSVFDSYLRFPVE